MTNLNETSLNLLNPQTGGFIAWIVFGTINTISSILIICTIVIWKPLHSDTQFIAANLAVCDIGMSLSTIGIAIYHLHNVYFQIPEVMLYSTCFTKSVARLIFLLIIPVFHTVLSLDRFISAVFPVMYRNRSRYYFLILTCTVWLGTPCMLVSLYFANFKSDNLVPLCMSRYATDATTSLVSGNFALIMSSLSVLIYIALVAILQYQIKKSSNATGNVAEIGNQIRNKVTLSVALIALLNFLSYTGFTAVSYISGSLVSNSTALSPYWNIFYVLGGVFSFGVYIRCQTQFKDGFHYFLGKIKLKSNNTVTSMY